MGPSLFTDSSVLWPPAASILYFTYSAGMLQCNPDSGQTTIFQSLVTPLSAAAQAKTLTGRFYLYMNW